MVLPTFPRERAFQSREEYRGHGFLGGFCKAQRLPSRVGSKASKPGFRTAPYLRRSPGRDGISSPEHCSRSGIRPARICDTGPRHPGPHASPASDRTTILRPNTRPRRRLPHSSERSLSSAPRDHDGQPRLSHLPAKPPRSDSAHRAAIPEVSVGLTGCLSRTTNV